MLRRKTVLALAITLIGILGATAMMIASADDIRVANAAMKGDKEAVRNLLKNAADVNAAQGDGTTALHWAAMKGDAEMAQMLLFAGANVRATTRIGSYTPLFLAAKIGSAPVMDLLLKARSEVDAKAANGITPLMVAAVSGNREAVRLLLDSGADVNAKETEVGQTSMIFAAAFDRAEVIAELAKHGGDLNLATKVTQPPQRPNFGPGGGGGQQQQGQQQAGQAAVPGQPPAQGQGGGQRGQRNAVPPPAGGAAPAAAQPQRGQGNAVPAVAGQVDPQVQGVQLPPDDRGSRSPRGGLTPLMYAARDGRLNSIKALIDAGAKLNERSADRSTALLIASINGHFDVARYLVEHGADVSLRSIDDATPLYGVLHIQWSRESERPQPSIKREQTGYLELIKLMLDNGANPNAKLGRTLWYTSFGNPYESASDIGTTPFWKCAAVGDMDGMKLLLSRGADAKIANKDGVDALLIASGAGTHGNDDIEAPHGRLATVKFLVDELHFDVNVADNGATQRGEPAAQQGQQQGQPVPVAGAVPVAAATPVPPQPVIPNQFMGPAASGYTALHNAASRGDNEMILFLVARGAKVDVVTKSGVTVVDMANGPRQRVQPYASTIALLEMLGATNSHKCISC